MEISFSGKRVMVTGAGRGIGRAICIRLGECGAKVIAVSKSLANLEALRAELPGDARSVCVDLGDWERARPLLRAEVERAGVHALVNNAAVALLAPFDKVTPQHLAASFAVNVHAPLLLSQLVAESMRGRGEGGAIVHVSSQASRAALPDHTVYCATKAALDALSRSMALELGPHGIRVNCVNPTVVMTDMGRLGWSDPAKAGPMLARIPLRRFARESDVVDAVLFLLSERAAMINGVELPVDGGFLAC